MTVPRARVAIAPRDDGQRGRCSVPRPGVTNSPFPGSWTSAVCHTPRGFTIASPACSSTLRCSPSISWITSIRPLSSTTSSSPAGWRSHVVHDAGCGKTHTIRPSSPSAAKVRPYRSSHSCDQSASPNGTAVEPSPRCTTVESRSNASPTGSILPPGSRRVTRLCGEVPGVGVDFGAVGAEDAEVLMVERGVPVAVLVEEDVVSSTQVHPVGDARVAAVFPELVVVDVAPGGDRLTARPLTMGTSRGDGAPLGSVPHRCGAADVED